MTPKNPPGDAVSAVSARPSTPATGNLDVVAGSADPETLPHSCGGCPTRWSGARTSHCPACHQTFTGVTTFDLHRNGGRCLRPWAMGMVIAPGRACTVWGNIGDPTE